ncbi:uncharacterized protein LOC126739824 [Anthonomus grandis grandis]|uniref:uncharacterized protein LOC126739824 n=1 Tax=Anthonomus grandis grandis TaxID=2921223 RepID=UPI0021652D19|nr:uncharacterized protein LOC126739824 [Anthonomus grandis grandis]
MNKQYISLLFSILLGSTYVHDLGANYIRGSPLIKSETHDRIRRDIQNPGLNLRVIAGLLVITNSTANAALAVDVNANLFALLDGTSGSATCINLTTGKGIYLPEGVWKAKSGSLENVLKSLPKGLSSLLTRSGCTVVTSIESASKKVQQEVSSILAELLTLADADLIRDPSLGLGLVSDIVKDLIKVLKGGLNGLLKVIANDNISLSGDLAGITNILKGLDGISQILEKDLETLVKEGAKIRSQPVLGAANGLECLLNVILQLAPAVDFSPLGEKLKTLPDLCILIGQLGGNVSTGITGIFQILGQITSLPDDPIAIVTLLNCLIQFVTLSHPEDLHGLEDKLDGLLKNILDALKKLGVSDDLKNVKKLATDILKQNLIFEQCNLSRVIYDLINNLESLGPLGLISKVVQLIKKITPPNQLLPNLLLILIIKLNSPIGTQQLIDLDIPINIDLSQIKDGKSLKSILDKIPDLRNRIESAGSLYDALNGLPVIKDIIKALNSAINLLGDSSLNLKKLLGSNGIVEGVIKAILQVISEVDLGACQTDLDDAKIAYTKSISLQSLLHLDIELPL